MKIYNRHGERVYLFVVTKAERTELKIRRKEQANAIKSARSGMNGPFKTNQVYTDTIQVGEAVIGLESLKILLPAFDALTGDTAKADIERVRAEQGIHPIQADGPIPSKTFCNRCQGLHDPIDLTTCNRNVFHDRFQNRGE